MATATGTVCIVATQTTFSLIVKIPGPPPTEKEFANITDDWIKDAVKGNAGAAVTVTYTETPPDPPVISAVRVG